MKNLHIAFGTAITLILGSAGIEAASAQSITTTFTYDALGRLVSASAAGGPVNGEITSIAYDAAGNRTSHAVSGASSGALFVQSDPSSQDLNRQIQTEAPDNTGALNLRTRGR